MNNLLEKFIILLTSITLPFTNIKGNLNNRTALSDLSNQPIVQSTPECYLSGGGIGGDLQEGIANYGVVGNTAHLFAGIWADNSLVSNSWLFDGETWVEVNHTGDQYSAELNFDKIYDHTGDYNLASYWRFTDGSDLLCTGGLIKVYYKDIVNLGIKELTYSSSIFPNRGTSNIYFNGSHQYVGFIRLYLEQVTGNNTAIPINSTTWELRVNDQLIETYGNSGKMGEWGQYWYSYWVTLPDVNQVEISLVTPAFNAGEGNGSFASFNTFDNILVLSRDKQEVGPNVPKPPNLINPTPTPQPTNIPLPSISPTPLPTETPMPTNIVCPSRCSEKWAFVRIDYYESADGCDISAIPQTVKRSVDCNCTLGTDFTTDYDKFNGDTNSCLAPLATPWTSWKNESIPVFSTNDTINADIRSMSRDNYPQDVVFTIWKKENDSYQKIDSLSSTWRADVLNYPWQYYSWQWSGLSKGNYQWRANVRDTQGNHLFEDAVLIRYFNIK